VTTKRLFCKAVLNTKFFKMVFAQTTFSVDKDGKRKDEVVNCTAEGIHTEKGERNLSVGDPNEASYTVRGVANVALNRGSNVSRKIYFRRL
jgi:hypothetical protein